MSLIWIHFRDCVVTFESESEMVKAFEEHQNLKINDKEIVVRKFVKRQNMSMWLFSIRRAEPPSHFPRAPTPSLCDDDIHTILS